jgi:hypothetical protein
MHKIDETYKTYHINSFKFQLPKYIAIVLFPNPIYICFTITTNCFVIWEGNTFEEWKFSAFLVNGMREVLI